MKGVDKRGAEKKVEIWILLGTQRLVKTHDGRVVKKDF